MIPLFKPLMAQENFQQVKDTLYSGYITQGPRVEEFEQLLKDYHGNDYVLTVNSATSGLNLALHIAKLKYPDKDTVLMCPLTCMAATCAILANGLKIKWVDCMINCPLMDMKDAAKKLDKNVLAIIPMHWGGHRCEDIPLKVFDAVGHKPYIIEDCAHAFGTLHENRSIAHHSKYEKNVIRVFSHQAIKLLTTGDGGSMAFSNREDYLLAKRLRWYGIDRDDADNLRRRNEQDVSHFGFKYHMNDIAASIGIANFQSALKALEKTRENAWFLLTKAEPDSCSVLFEETKGNISSSYWLYTINVSNRSNFIFNMEKEGIQTSFVHKRNDGHSCVREFKSYLPNVDRMEKQMVCVPVGWWLSKEELKHVAEATDRYKYEKH